MIGYTTIDLYHVTMMVLGVFVLVTLASARITRIFVGDKITASAPPTISSATHSTDSTLTGWTTTFNDGDVFRFNVDSATTIQRVTLSLRVRVR